MARPSSSGGGILIAIGAMIGAGVGLVKGQGSLGLLIGLAAGTAAALALWLADLARRR